MPNVHIFPRLEGKRIIFNLIISQVSFRFKAKCEMLTFSPATNENIYQRLALMAVGQASKPPVSPVVTLRQSI
jgi:hypothetical protein